MKIIIGLLLLIISFGYEIEYSFSNYPASMVGTGYTISLSDSSSVVKEQKITFDNYVMTESNIMDSFIVTSNTTPNASETLIIGESYAYPNPFSESTQIGFELNRNADIKIYIYNIYAIPVRMITCSSGGIGGVAGYNKVSFDGTDNLSNRLPNGVYIYLLVNNNRVIYKGKLGINR
ncbi:MAG: hypothetical protein A2Y40_01320 [Candidatus Margulisbacteria bacterium GWF2_35_9]|nr:MAG: hypothetical protein A2Y40_01320 [Candidatus Margulisbacteria bacterium GWF2_35_9]